MKKLILISLVIFFAICSRSWAQECPGSDTSKWNNCIGTKVWASGSSYTGEWNEGRRNGQGTHTHYNGDIDEGIWKDNKCIDCKLYRRSGVIIKKSKDLSIPIKEFKPKTLKKPNAEQIEAMENYNSPQAIRKREIELQQKELQYKKKQELIKRNREKHNPEVKRNRELEEHNKKLVKQKREQEMLIKKEKQTFENAKLECEAIGYKKGTEKFGECVLDLTE
jgi:hypothetical protein